MANVLAKSAFVIKTRDSKVPCARYPAAPDFPWTAQDTVRVTRRRSLASAILVGRAQLVISRTVRAIRTATVGEPVFLQAREVANRNAAAPQVSSLSLCSALTFCVANFA